MESDLKALNNKLTELISISRALKSQNIALTQQLAAAEAQTKQTVAQMHLAGEKLAALIASLPDELAEPVLHHMAEDLED